MILPDTSVWVEYFRGNSPYRQILRHHLEVGNVTTTDFIFGELLQGARSTKETEILTDYLAALPVLTFGNQLWLEAGLLSFREKAFSRGVGLIDLAIVCAARQAGAKIWSRDKKLLSILKKEEKFHAKK